MIFNYVIIYLFFRDKRIKNDLYYGVLLSQNICHLFFFLVCHLFLNREFQLTFFCRTQWKMNINIPCRELKMVKRYAMMTVLSLIYMSPKAQVNPNRQRRAIAPITHDLQREEKIKSYQIVCLQLTQSYCINNTDTEKNVTVSLLTGNVRQVV